MKNLIPGIYLVIGIVMLWMLVTLFTSCEKEQVTPNEPTQSCKCGVLTEKDWYMATSGLVWKYKVRNECTNNNQWVNLSTHIQSGGTTDIGDYVCAEYEW
jgi:hypothetical protein